MVPLTPAMFGAPPRAAQCPACGLWFPFENFLRRDGKSRRRVARCRACITARKRASGLVVALAPMRGTTVAPEPTRPPLAPLSNVIVSKTARKRAAGRP